MHVLEPPAELPEAWLIAATADDEVLPVVSILAVDHELDVAIVRVAGFAGDPGTLEGVRTLRLDVSTPWAPGSSGAAVLDAAGNAVGHAWSIFEIGGPEPLAAAGAGEVVEAAPGDFEQPALRLHQAVPARGVRLLVDGLATPP